MLTAISPIAALRLAVAALDLADDPETDAARRILDRMERRAWAEGRLPLPCEGCGAPTHREDWGLPVCSERCREMVGREG